jgi:hypothetical protein
MSERSELARLALSVVEGVTAGDADAGGLITEAFDAPDLAARAYAYLSGFILEVFASEKFDGSTALAVAEVRKLLDRSA